MSLIAWDLTSDSPLLGLDDGRKRARFSVSVPAPKGTPAEGGGTGKNAGSRLLAGAAEVDITPPPGMPKAGYSANAHDGVGFRTRLRARVFHLSDGRASMAIVACDLLGGSAVLQRLVARHLAELSDVPLAGVMIGATHTHAAPGQFLGTDFYNRFASNRAGFDPAWAQFLATRIAGAAAQAVATRRPAVMASGTIDVWGLTRNRSLAPHVRNPDVGDKRLEAQRKFAAVNPGLHLIRIDATTAAAAGDTEPMGALCVFSVHGTGISQHAHAYNADVWAYLCGELAHRVEQAHGTRPVVGAIEGTHADVAPAIRPGAAGYLEAQRVGRGIGEVAAALYEDLGGRLRSDVELGCALHEIELATCGPIDGITLPSRPAVGAALVAGAVENLTPVLGGLPPFKAGMPKPHRPHDPQGAKWVIGSRFLQPIVLPRKGFPRVLPVQILRLGSTALVGLPFEITVESGRRIGASVRRALVGGSDGSNESLEVVVSSVANEYSGYVATAEEYDLQYYEGGHTLYGPKTQRFLAAHAGALAGRLAFAGPGATVSEVIDQRSFDLRAEHYLARPSGVPGSAVERAEVSAASYTDPTPLVDGYWEWVWRDAPPGDLVWHEPLVAVESDGAGDGGGGGGWDAARRSGRLVNDGGWDLEIVHLGPDDRAPGGRGNAAHRYQVRWYDPQLGAPRRHRFVLLPNSSQSRFEGQAFD